MIITTDKKPTRPRDPDDHYPTPAPHVRATLGLIDATPSTILDPGAGSGVWGQHCRTAWPDATITGVELRSVAPASGYDVWRTDNFLTTPFKRRQTFDLIVGNPPFKLAESFVRRSLSLLAPGGTLIFLLRLAFLETQGRVRGLWRCAPPRHVAVYATRPSFLGNGSRDTDGTAYAAFLWQQGWCGVPTIGWLETEKEEKRRPLLELLEAEVCV
jgi:SAM-dependent methyltransferase